MALTLLKGYITRGAALRPSNLSVMLMSCYFIQIIRSHNQDNQEKVFNFNLN